VSVFRNSSFVEVCQGSAERRLSPEVSEQPREHRNQQRKREYSAKKRQQMRVLAKQSHAKGDSDHPPPPLAPGGRGVCTGPDLRENAAKEKKKDPQRLAIPALPLSPISLNCLLYDTWRARLA
jgi:hypothetical protein